MYLTSLFLLGKFMIDNIFRKFKLYIKPNTLLYSLFNLTKKLIYSPKNICLRLGFNDVIIIANKVDDFP